MRLAAALLAAIACLGPTETRAAAGPAALEKARALFEAQKWSKAAEAYEAILKEDPSSGENWFRMGLSYRMIDRCDRALAAYQEAERRGYSTLQLLGSAAICWSAAGAPDDAFAYLERAVAQGMNVQILRTLPDLASLRADPRFPALLEKAEKKAHPCEHDPRYRAFDFWVGEWDVLSNGQKVGENRIEKTLSGCVLMESWTDAFGSSGRSMNYLDPSSGKWRQNWVSENGTVVRYEGAIVNGAMRYEGESVAPDGAVTRTRVTIEPKPDGSVRHVIENSTDSGATWSAAFDATYVRKK